MYKDYPKILLKFSTMMMTKVTKKKKSFPNYVYQQKSFNPIIFIFKIKRAT